MDDGAATTWNVFVLIGLLLALVVTVPASMLLLWLYRAAVERAMRKTAGTTAPGAGGGTKRSVGEAGTAAGTTPGAIPGTAPDLAGLRLEIVTSIAGDDDPEAALLRATSARVVARNAFLYAAAGALFGLLATVLILRLEAISFSAPRLLLVTPILAWLVVPTLAAVTRAGRLVWAAGAAFYLAVWALGRVAYGSDLTWLWIVNGVIPTVIALGIGNRWLRSAAPIVLLVLLLVAVGVVGGGSTVLFVLFDVEPNGGAPSLLLGAAALVVLPLAGLLVPFVFASMYRRQRWSDQTMLVTTWWLLYALWLSVMLATSRGVWGLAALALAIVFDITLRIGFRATRGAGAADAPRSLLLLRVFGHQNRSERLLRDVEAFWRPLGTVDLIAGRDLATENLEPHELVAFMTGRLGRVFVRDVADLEPRLAADARRPDPDGRHRVIEFFCHDDTWRPTLRALVARASAILMDLRGFSPDNAGCIHELSQLVDLAPLDRVILLVDESTDADLLATTLRRAWSDLAPDSPNAGAPAPVVSGLDAGGRARDQRRRVVTALARTAASTAST